MNMSEVMKLKRELQANYDIDAKMLDTSEDGFVLFVERKTILPESYKCLADFAAQKQLNLQLDSGNYILSLHALPLH